MDDARMRARFLKALPWLLLLVVPEVALVVYVGLARPDPGFGRYRYVPYVEYVTDRTAGDGTPDGFAPTANPFPDAAPIWLFGGSAMHGGFTHNPPLDCEPTKPCTIASHLAALLADDGLRYAVLNLGMYNYGINQERTLFQEMLRRRGPPEVAVFYHGVNDAETRAGRVGHPNEFLMIQGLLEGREAPSYLVSRLAESPWKTLHLLDYLVNRWHRAIAPAEPGPDPFLAERLEDGRPAFLDGIVGNYKHNVRLIQAVCREFDVACFFVWQPISCFKKRLTEDESRNLAGRPCGGTPWLPEVYDRIEKDPDLLGMTSFVNLARLFQDVDEHIFHDDCHLDEAFEGQRIVAARLRDIIEPALRR